MKRFFLLLALVLLLSGCKDSLVPSEYTVITKQNETAAETATDAVRAEDYDGLKYAMLSLIRAGVQRGVIHVYRYEGDLVSDVPLAAHEVWKDDPLGAYAVEYLTTDCNLLVSYYEIRVQITYRPEADLQQIHYVRGTQAASDAIAQALCDMQPHLVLRISSYDAQLDCAQLAADYCAENPQTIVETPEVTVSSYPDHGSSRIVELDFSYDHTQAELLAMRSAVGSVLSAAESYVRYRQEASVRAELLYTFLSERFDYTTGETNTPFYSLLCEGVASSESFAQIFQTLCDRAGLPCITVSGYLDGERYDWNILCLDDTYHHIDLLRNIEEDVHQLRYYSDDDMLRYSWDRSAYPACGAQTQSVAPESETEASSSGTEAEQEPAAQPPQPDAPQEDGAAQTPQEPQPEEDLPAA